jgi:16S rRNA (cytosine1402-N4)-methyltransferase
MTAQPPVHIPVMMADMMAALGPQNGETYIDGTFGAGGYTTAILNAAKTAHVVAFDRDPEARARYDAMPDATRAHITFIDAPFSNMHDELAAHSISNVDGVVFDLGVSSPQIDNAARGFSFRFDGPLDMRMDPRAGLSAADIVNTYDERDLANIIFKYGEEHKSRAIARAIVNARKTAPIQTTEQLAAIIRTVIRPNPRDKIDPCTRTFQALRIAVNAELDELERALPAAVSVLKPGGRLVVVTFHSLEDRIVKDFFKTFSGRAPGASRHVPQTIQAEPLLSIDTHRAQNASDDEAQKNPRARSAKLRVAVRTAAPIPHNFINGVAA